jgi:hypothetical protein
MAVLLALGVLALAPRSAFAQAPPTIFHYQLCLSGGPVGLWRLNFVPQGNSILVTGDKANDPDDNWGVLTGSMTINTSGEVIIGLTAIGWNTTATNLGYAGETIMFRAGGAPYTSWGFRQARYGSTISFEPNTVVTGTATVVACP